MNLTENNQPTADGPNARAFADHSRHWDRFKYVYPVLSRRSKGLSIGVNLNPDTICNFDCVYCQVEKITPPRRVPVDTRSLEEELDEMLRVVTSGAIWSHERFQDVAPDLRRLNDIAFSGDGEPTTTKCFARSVDIAVELKRRYQLDETKLVVITNATRLDRPEVESALRVMDEHGGEVWAKLDAGTQAYYDQVDRSAVTLQRVLDNILACGQHRDIVIQSMFMKMHGEPIPDAEFDAYAERLVELINAGCRIRRVQLYTVARKPLETYVEPLTDQQLHTLSERLVYRLTHAPGGGDVQVEFYGQSG